MEELKIVAQVVVKKQFQPELEKAFRTVVDETRKEPGNISYDLHRDVGNPLKYTILEVWKSQDAIDRHNASAHFRTFAAAIEDKVDALDIDVIRKIY